MRDFLWSFPHLILSATEVYLMWAIESLSLYIVLWIFITFLPSETDHSNLLLYMVQSHWLSSDLKMCLLIPALKIL